MTFCFWELRWKLCSALTLGCLLCSVVAQEQELQIQTSSLPGVDFSKYHTYRWVEVKGQHPESTLDAQIKQAVDSQLGAKGLTKTNDATSDLDIDYQTATSQTQEWQAYEDWTDTSPGGERLPQHKMVTINIGTLVIDMYDTAAKNRVWTGRAQKAIDVNSNQEERQKNLNNVAKQLLKGFPPK